LYAENKYIAFVYDVNNEAREAVMPETITDFIKQDLRARLRGGAGLPEKLTLAALSEHYDVSFTPVRLAVQELIDERVLRKEPNGRMTVARVPNGKPPPAPVPARPEETSSVEASLTAKVIQMSLLGHVEYLREEATAEHMGIGRTVLRQLLNRLAGKGLVEHLPRRGWRVRRYDEAEMFAYLQVRESLELKALELARPHLVAADLQRMLRGNQPFPGGKTERLDNDLHQYLIDKSGNRYIQDFFARHGLYYSTLFDYAAPEANVVRAMARQHRVILRALFAQDWRRARQALAHHIRSQRPIVHRLLQRIGQGGQDA
jgi:DNA-binding GntR family transcriptional regulator